MASEKMYDLAFQYRGTKLWKMLYDDELFAVRLSDGEIGYCCVMGMLGDHIALGLYVGETGYRSYRKLFEGLLDGSNMIAVGELFSSQECLQCSFENKDMLSDEELEEVRRYAGMRGKPLRGKNAFPQFTKYRIGKLPWRFDSETDERRICDALSAAAELKHILGKYTKEELGLLPLKRGASKIPMMCDDGERWVVRYTELPDVTEEYPAPVYGNDVLAARIKGMKKKGTWECGIMRLLKPVQDVGTEDQAPYYPLALIAVDRQDGSVLPPVVSSGDDAAEMVKRFTEDLLAKACPRAIRAGDDQCFSLLRDLCAKMGIRLTREDNLHALDEVMEALAAEMAADDDMDDDTMQERLYDFFDALIRMEDGELKQMPPSQVGMLLDMADEGVMPDVLANRLRKLFQS